MRKINYGLIKSCGIGIAITLCLSITLTTTFARNDSGQDEFAPILIEYFYEPGCSECTYISNSVLPELEQRYAGFYTLNHCDTGIEDNYLKLVAYQNELKVFENEPVYMIVDGRYVLSGAKPIRTDLFPLIDRLVAAYLEMPYHYKPSELPVQNVDEKALLERLNQFTFAGIAIAGLIDGINPCAISTLVFFISVLSVLKIKNRTLIIVGCSFCLASFVTYLMIGFGLLRAISLFSGFQVFSYLIEAVMITILVFLSFFSIRDALRYAKTRDSRTVTIQLPQPVKERIHRIMQNRLTYKNLIFGSFVTGMIVTALESVCTGQVYVPTLVFLAKRGEKTFLSMCYLFAYNLMFITPIVLTLVLALKGLSVRRLITWSKRNVVVSKSVLAVFFLFMAFLLIVL